MDLPHSGRPSAFHAEIPPSRWATTLPIPWSVAPGRLGPSTAIQDGSLSGIELLSMTGAGRIGPEHEHSPGRSLFSAVASRSAPRDHQQPSEPYFTTRSDLWDRRPP